jgi:hypothetical protein
MNAKQEYLDLLEELLSKRESADWTDDQEDPYLDRLDPLWWAMSKEEQVEVGHEIEKLYP